jgi:Flp pilus assembly protein TadD
MAGAEAAYRAAVRLAPRDADSLSRLGYVLLQQGRVEEGRACFTAALAIDPRNDLSLQCLRQLPPPPAAAPAP